MARRPRVGRSWRSELRSDNEHPEVDAALDAMTAGELRELIRGMLPWIDESTRRGMFDELIEKAARGNSSWTPAGPDAERVATIVAFVERARREGDANAHEVDRYLRDGSDALLAGDHASAVEIFRAILVPIATAEIYLGQDEMVDEVLSVDFGTLAARYAISIYMTVTPEERAVAVRAGFDELGDAGRPWSPLRDLGHAAAAPLPEFEDFLQRWRALLQETWGAERPSGWDSFDDRWLREATQRLDGADGLGKLARSTRRAEDYRAWCKSLVDAQNWQAALAAYGEAAGTIAEKTHWRGDFFDGAALAAQELGRKDLPTRLERAWRGAPSMLRLRRWLGSSRRKAIIRKRAAQALDACPTQARRQRALLHLILDDVAAAAKLLAAAPGLGWSDCEHPGHLLFPLFQQLLHGDVAAMPTGPSAFIERGIEIDELEGMAAGPGVGFEPATFGL